MLQLMFFCEKRHSQINATVIKMTRNDETISAVIPFAADNQQFPVFLPRLSSSKVHHCH